MLITAPFTQNGAPKTGLTPTITIWNALTGLVVVNNAPMVEVDGSGVYRYDFALYNSSMDYAFVCDGGVAQPSGERYAFGGNESYLEEIQAKIQDSTDTILTAVRTIKYGPPTADFGG